MGDPPRDPPRDTTVMRTTQPSCERHNRHANDTTVTQMTQPSCERHNRHANDTTVIPPAEGLVEGLLLQLVFALLPSDEGGARVAPDWPAVAALTLVSPTMGLVLPNGRQPRVHLAGLQRHEPLLRLLVLEDEDGAGLVPRAGDLAHARGPPHPPPRTPPTGTPIRIGVVLPLHEALLRPLLLLDPAALLLLLPL
eukprot:1176314-Prorocentrum_minimum.AAC.1